jgi:AraC family transcriptional activator of pobA
MISYKDYLVLQKLDAEELHHYFAAPFYQIFLISGKGTLYIDFIEFEFSGKIALFTSPYQHLKISGNVDAVIEKLAFHGDFYCIEYHKKEVACNGLLFNNIYQQPFIYLKDEEISSIFKKIALETEKKEPYTEPVLKSYLQLILAIASRIKHNSKAEIMEGEAPAIEKFRELLEENFMEERTPLFYANALAMAASTFTKQCTKRFGKAPSVMIQERVILEAKKHLHLSHKSSKEIASLMNFDDQHYFSRYFKKHTGVSPTRFRNQVGISIVADLSII